MDYPRAYEKLIDKFRDQKPEGYCESHHIVPRCLGGSDDPKNLVKLPARVHFVAHLLLAKIHGGKLIHAAWMMSNEGYARSRKYAWLRERHSKLTSQRLKGRKESPETTARRVDTRRKNGGYIVTDETRAAMSKARKGRKFPNRKKISAEARKRIGLKQRGKKRPHVSEKQRGSGNQFYGKKHSDASKQKMRIAQLGKKHPYKKRKPLTEEQKAAKSEHNLKIGLRPPKMFGNDFNKGKIWVSNMDLNINTLVKPGDLSAYLSNGYHLGRSRIKQRNKVA